MNTLSACFITLNEEENLPRALASLAGIADEIVIVDSGSTDRTIKLWEPTEGRCLHTLEADMGGVTVRRRCSAIRTNRRGKCTAATTLELPLRRKLRLFSVEVFAVLVVH